MSFIHKQEGDAARFCLRTASGCKGTELSRGPGYPGNVTSLSLGDAGMSGVLWAMGEWDKAHFSGNAAIPLAAMKASIQGWGSRMTWCRQTCSRLLADCYWVPPPSNAQSPGGESQHAPEGTEAVRAPPGLPTHGSLIILWKCLLLSAL